MKLILKLITIVGIIFMAGIAFALQPIVVGLNDDIHFDYQGYRANDFHIEGIVYSAGGIEPNINEIIIFGDPGTGNWSKSGWTLTPVPGSPDQWRFTMDFVTDGFITFCQWIHFGIEFNVEAKNIIARLVGWWTLDGEPMQVGDSAQVAVTGFEVTKDPTGAPQFRLRISNDSSLPVQVSQMEWVIFEDANLQTVEPDPVPLEDMSKKEGGVGRPGEDSLKYPHLIWLPVQTIPDRVEIRPGSFFDVFFDVQIPPGNFLMLRGRQVPAIFMESKTVQEDWGWFWEQHQEPLENPNTPIVVAINDDVHFDYDLRANDFHVEGIVESTNGTRPTVRNIIIYGDSETGVWQESGHTLEPIPGTNAWKFTIDFKTDGVITFCQWIHFGIMFEVMDKNIIADLKGWWTWNGNPVVAGPTRPGQVAVTGFNIFKEGRGTRLIMTNDTDMPIAVSQIQAKVFEAPVPLGEMSKLGLGIPQENSDWRNVLEEFGAGEILQPDSFFDVFVEVEIPTDGTILVRGRQLMVSDDGTINDNGGWGWFWEQHQEPGIQEPPPPLDGIKWKQRPDMKTGVNIESIASFDGGRLPSVADDWLCLGGSPVSDLHFWGSYPEWEKINEVPSDETPGVQAFKIQIYSDIPASADQANKDFSRPGRLLYETWVKDFSETYVASISLPWGTGQEPIFEHKYRYDLDLPRIFWQRRGTIYWLNISAVPNDSQIPWGWENSMDRWNDVAVERDYTTDKNWERLYHPFFDPPLVPLDMSFELTTCGGPVKWLQFPDMAQGLNIVSYPLDDQNPDVPGALVADDFLCTNGEPVTEVHFWGSYLTRDNRRHWSENTPMPPIGIDRPKMQSFNLGFYLDVPAGNDPEIPWSHPAARGQLYNVTLTPDEVETQYWDSIPHTRYYQGEKETWWEHKYYHVADLTQEGLKPFFQDRDNIYWLSLSATPDCTGTEPCYYWGWETSMDHWNDAAVKGNSSFWKNLGGKLVDFNDLTAGTTYDLNPLTVNSDQFTSRGVLVSLADFQWGNGDWNDEGTANVTSGNAGGTGNDMNLNNVNLKFDFPAPVHMLSLLYKYTGGNMNLQINNDFRNFNTLADMHDTYIGGVHVTVNATGSPGNSSGSIQVEGIIHDFMIGGQEFWIDDIRTGKTDMAFALMTKDDTDYCRVDFDRDGDVDKDDFETFATDFGRNDCVLSGDCEGDFHYDGDVDGLDLTVIAGELGRTDCPCSISSDGVN